MKKITIILTVLLAMAMTTNAQWHYQNPLHSGHNYGFFKFDDRNNGRIIYSNGDYLSTTDQGDNWEINYINPKLELGARFFLNDNLGWAVRYSTIWKTVDGGDIWIQVRNQDNEFRSESFYSIYFINEYKGFAVGREGYIWKSTNGGLDWEKTHTIGMKLYKIKFRDENVGFIIGGLGGLVRTNDGGENWTSTPTSGWERASNIFFFGNDTIYIKAGTNKIVKTYTDGTYWFEDDTNINGNILAMNFLDRNLGYAFGKDGLIYKTYDGGDNWENQSVELDPGCSLGSSYFFDKDHGIVTGSHGYLFKTDNGGENWYDLSYGSRESMFNISFLNESKGYTLGSHGKINETENGGMNWYSKQLPADVMLYNICYINDQEYIICGNNGTLLLTTDSGENWNVIPTSITSKIVDVYFTSSDSGLILCMDGKIYKTSNQCETVTEVRNIDTENYSNMYFTDSQNGTIVGKKNTSPQTGIILNTSDGGENWTLVYEVEKPLTSVHFVNSSFGWAVGDYGQVFNTIDGGNTWDSLYIGETIHLSDVSFANTEKGWATGGYGMYYETSDGGITWTRCPKFNNYSLYSVCSVNDTTVWVTGPYGDIINRGVTQSIGIDEPSVVHSSISVLNYPNPFNNNTFVDITMKNKGSIQVYAYNLNGQLVYYGHDYSIQSGKHTVIINGTSLESGLYTFKIITKEDEMNGKFIVFH